jgi:CRP-like cAMP-binding protein
VESATTIGLLEAEPDLGRFLTDEEWEEASHVRLAVRSLSGEVDLAALLVDAHAFGALIISGMLLDRIYLGEQPMLRLLGPGDMVAVGAARARLLDNTACTAVAGTAVAMLDDRVLVAARRWPRLIAALHLQTADQSERLALQLAICQLPRVADRLLGLLWLLADSWGHVTPSGVSVPVTLTHDLLGWMIGARRPTVTLALGELCDRGAVVRQDHGWLLLERLGARSGPSPTPPDEPTVFGRGLSPWSEPSPESSPSQLWSHEELLACVARLRATHGENRARVRQRLVELRLTRERLARRREQLTPPRHPVAP